MKQDELNAIAARFHELIRRRTTEMAGSVVNLDAARYTDPGRFEREREALFRTRPQIVGMSCDLPAPGDWLTRVVADVPIIIVRRQNGGLASFINTCRHRGARLVEGSGSGARSFVCPYHAWSYASESGELTGIPYQEGFEGLDRGRCALQPLPVEERHGLIGLIPAPGLDLDLADYLGSIGEELGSFDFQNLHFVKERVATIRANWKLANDTGQEGYHVPFLHKDSVAPMTIPNATLYDRYGDHHRLGFAAPEIAELMDRPVSEWNAESSVLSKLQLIYGIFPSTTIVVSHHLIALQRLDPGPTPGESIFRIATYSIQPIESDEHRQFAEAMFDGLFDLLKSEDYATVANVQRALEAGALGEMILGRNEPALQRVHAAYDRVLAEAGVADAGV